MNYYIECFKKYATFSGRARRKEYWMFILFSMLASVGITIIDAILCTGGLLVTAYDVAVLVPSLAVGVRRLHDTDRSGWMLLIALIPLIGVIVLLVFTCTEGTRGDNRFGPDPKAV